MSKKRKLAYLALLINTIVWGAAAPIVKPALSFISPEKFLFYRFFIATILSLPIALFVLQKKRLKLWDYGKIILLELLGTTILLWLVYTALSLTTAVESSLIYSTSPLFVTIAGIIFLKEHETLREWKGLFFALLGTIFVTVAPLVQHGNFGLSKSFFGNFLMVSQNILWALYLIIAKKTYRKYSKLAVTTISFWVGAVSFYFLAFPLGNPLASFVSDIVHPPVAVAVLYMAIFGSIIGATLYLFGQNLIEVSEASIFTYLQALVALPLSILWLGEKLTPVMILGAFVIALGVYLGEFSARGGGKRGVSNAH